MNKEQEKFEENISIYVGEHKEHIKAVLRQSLINNGLKDSSIININESNLEKFTKKILLKGVTGSIDKNGNHKLKKIEVEKLYYFNKSYIKYEINGIEKIIYSEERDLRGFNDLSYIIDHKYNFSYTSNMINDLNKEIEYEELKIKFPIKEIKTKKSKI